MPAPLHLPTARLLQLNEGWGPSLRRLPWHSTTRPLTAVATSSSAYWPLYAAACARKWGGEQSTVGDGLQNVVAACLHSRHGCCASHVWLEPRRRWVGACRAGAALGWAAGQAGAAPPRLHPCCRHKRQLRRDRAGAGCLGVDRAASARQPLATSTPGARAAAGAPIGAPSGHGTRPRARWRRRGAPKARRGPVHAHTGCDGPCDHAAPRGLAHCPTIATCRPGGAYLHLDGAASRAGNASLGGGGLEGHGGLHAAPVAP